MHVPAHDGEGGSSHQGKPGGKAIIELAQLGGQGIDHDDAQYAEQGCRCPHCCRTDLPTKRLKKGEHPGIGVSVERRHAEIPHEKEGAIERVCEDAPCLQAFE